MRTPSHLPLAQLLDELVVFFMATDPKPDNQLSIAAREHTIMISDSHGPNICAKRLELHRRMKWIPLPKAKLISRETWNVRR
jgi:hypothetical protein